MRNNSFYQSIAGQLVVVLSVTILCGPIGAQPVNWPNESVIDHERLIPSDETVNVAPGSTIRFSDHQLKILGQLVVQGRGDAPTAIIIPNLLNLTTAEVINRPVNLKLSSNLKELEIYPYSVDTKEIVDELRAFRYQYALVWTVLMAINFYLVLNKSKYW